MERNVFFISDRTGITAEMLGQSLLSQFEDNVRFNQKTLPFIDTPEKAHDAVARINAAAENADNRPLIFETVVRPEIRAIIAESKGIIMDFFHTFIGPLETELGAHSSFSVGKAHSTRNIHAYDTRIAAVNFALNNDDGASTRQYQDADIILVGVSRCGKTPTSLYMAMQFGIRAANYPFTEDDMERLQMPAAVKQFKKKVYGLTIDPMRLHQIRTERRANSRYASLPQCMFEVREVESLYRREQIPFLNTTSRSIEELAATIMAETGLERHIF